MNSKQRTVNSKQRLTQIVFLLCLLTTYYSLLTPVASAHSFATDGDITVLLHSNPDDDPIVGQPAAVLFQITDVKERFSNDNCDCTVAISQGNQVLFSGKLLRVVGASVYGFTAPVTFPAKAVYQITVTGKPKTGSAFQDFQVEFDLRVNRGAATETTSSEGKDTIPLVVGFGSAFALIVCLVIYLMRPRRK